MHKSYINIVMKMFFLDSEHIEMWGNAPNPQINHLYPTYLFTITISPLELVSHHSVIEWGKTSSSGRNPFPQQKFRRTISLKWPNKMRNGKMK